ncbi:MAG TPA: hypothetical protein VH186_21955 [Chloroflexia bacterium]|nr:hypothetical protein [Chloroflexia bacterium]
MPEYNNQKLLELARELLPGDSSLAEEVKEALKEPVVQGIKYEEYWDVTGPTVIEIEEDNSNFPWTTLLEGLLERGRLVEIPVNETPENITWELDELLVNRPEDPDRWNWLRTEGWQNKPLKQFLKEVQHRIIGRNRVLAYIEDEDFESYSLCLIKAARFGRIEQLVREAGFGKIVKVEDL